VATKWDDDDVERPTSRPAVGKHAEVKVDVDAWHAKMKAAAKAPPAVSERKAPPPTVITTSEAPKREIPAARVLSENEQERLAKEARRAAEAELHRAGPKRKVRLRVKVPGWYPGSVPAVDFCDGHGHHFASAPGNPPDTHEEYVLYWRAPFVAELKRLGFDVIEEDV
jgi:hypothetical protein